jgi:hypothetical protein
LELEYLGGIIQLELNVLWEVIQLELDVHRIVVQLELYIRCHVVQLELYVLCCNVQLELDDRLVNRSIKAYILTTAFYKSNPSLVILVVSLHIIFFHTC